MASIHNLSIPAIVVVLSACSHDCSPSLWQLFESSTSKVLRPGHDPGPQCELHILAVLEVPSVAEVFRATFFSQSTGLCRSLRHTILKISSDSSEYPRPVVDDWDSWSRQILRAVVPAVEFLEPSVTRLAKESYRAINFLGLVMNLSSNTVKVVVMKENGALVAMSAFHVWGCSSQATPYICDPVPLADHEVSYFHKNTDSTRDRHCSSLRHDLEKKVSLLVCPPNTTAYVLFSTFWQYLFISSVITMYNATLSIDQCGIFIK